MKRILCLMLALSLCAIAPAAAEKDNWLHVFLPGDPDTLDAQLTTSSYTVPLNCFDRLVEIDTVDGEAMLVPGLAESWEISDDGLTYTFHLREGVTFHNGDPFTADDVVYTVNRMMDPETQAMNTDIFYGIVAGAADCYDGMARSVSGVKALDDFTVRFTLEAPFAPFLSCLAAPGGSIFNRESTEGAKDFGVNPEACFGTGPFQVIDWSLGSRVTLRANPDYFRGAPAIDGVTLEIVPDPDAQRAMFEAGSVDVFNFDYAGGQLQWFLDNGWSERIVSGSRAGTCYFMFNAAIAPLDDVRVRRALQMAIDRQAILDELYSGEGRVLNTFIPEGVPGHSENAQEIPFDPDQARALLAEAGYADGFDMEIAAMSNSAALDVSDIIAGQLSRIGVRAEVRQYDESAYYNTRRSGMLPCYYNSWSADFDDPDNFLYTFFSKKNSKSRSINYQNEDIMALLEATRGMVDEDRRLAVCRAIDDAVVHEDAVTLPLFQLNHLFCLNPRVQGFSVPWNGWSGMSYYAISLTD